jgi:deazaflavin-dependent oxidoreductase (nitroreductase family)
MDREPAMSDWNRGLIDDLRANQGHATSGPFVGRQVLILTTAGAKTGEAHSAPLAWTRSGDDIVVVASMGGAPRNPSWYHNLLANPRVTVELDGERFEAIARAARPDERRRLYDAHADVHPGFRDYESKTSRVIPVVLLSRVTPAS